MADLFPGLTPDERRRLASLSVKEIADILCKQLLEERARAEKAEAERDEAIADRADAANDRDFFNAAYVGEKRRAEQAEAERDRLRALLWQIERHAFMQRVWGGVEGYILHPMSPINQKAIRDLLTAWANEECGKAVDTAKETAR